MPKLTCATSSGVDQHLFGTLLRILKSSFTISNRELRLDMEYEYSTLPKASSIRLLVFSSETAGKDDVSLSFVLADIDDKPPFAALSYVWGDESDKVPVTVDGRVIRVTQNLSDALKNFRDARIPMWVDAICINQEDVLEKTVQVNMMSRIYRMAMVVIVWLGRDEQNHAPVMWKGIATTLQFVDLVLCYGGAISHFDSKSGHLYWVDKWKRTVISKLPMAISRSPSEEFLRLPYWSRTWILQEVGLANQAAVYWGKYIINWNSIGIFAMFFHRYCKTLFHGLGLLQDLERLLQVYLAYSPFRPKATFMHVMNQVRRCNSKDPRDKVFALLSHPSAHTVGMTASSKWRAYRSVAAAAVLLNPDQAEQHLIVQRLNSDVMDEASEATVPLIKADYRVSTEDVYRSFALEHIARSESLEILAAVQHDSNTRSKLFSPSWVPRWDFCNDSPTIGFSSSDSNTSRSRRAILTPSINRKFLIVRGHLLSRVVFATGVLQPSDFDIRVKPSAWLGDHSHNIIAETWKSRFADLDPYEYPVLPHLSFQTEKGTRLVYDRDAAQVERAYMRTWVANYSIGELDGNTFVGESFRAAYLIQLGLISAIGEEALDRLSRRRSAKDLEFERNWRRYRDAAAQVCANRKFFSTKKGFIGIGPGALLEDDFVAVLQGADAPFIVREVVEDGESSLEERRAQNLEVPAHRKFQLVGECYVEGIMGGQATTAQQGTGFFRDMTFV